MSEAADYRVEVHSRSATGQVRQRNEDAFGTFSDGFRTTLLVVADGMGGHRGGSTASRMAVDTIGRDFEAAPADFAHNPQRLATAIGRASAAVYETAQQNIHLSGMGTTVVALLLAQGGGGGVAHAGDSRAYRLRTGQWTALTADHSLVAALVREGVITPEEALVHPRRNEISRCVGLEAEVEIDYSPVEVCPGDLFLLCSDGLHGVVPEAEITQQLASADGAAAALALIEKAHQYGSPDNVTVQVAVVKTR